MTAKLLTSAKTYSREDAETAAREYAIASVKLDNLTARMNARIQKIRDDYADQIAELQEQADNMKTIIQHWADSNAADFRKKKSVDFVHATAGYRTSNPALRTIRGVTWKKAFALIKAMRPDFIRTKEEVDKEAIIANRHLLKDDGLKALGVRIDQAEKFFIEPKVDEIKLTD